MKKSFKVSILSILMVICTILGSLWIQIPSYAEGGPVIKLHYHRTDGNYSGWDVWLWEEGKDGAGFEFNLEDGDMVATKEVTPGTNKVGFIVRTADWTKDINKDQFIDIAEVVSGTVDIYVESGVEGYTKELRDDVSVGIKLREAKYDGERTISVLLTSDIDEPNSAFSVKGRSGEVLIDKVTSMGEGLYEISLSSELNGNSSYTVSFQDTSYKVNMPNIYSTKKFEDEFSYYGDDLGYTYSKDKTLFRVWAPTAESVSLLRFESGSTDNHDLIEEIPMEASINGTWTCEVNGDCNGTYYTYNVSIDGKTTSAMDPYAKASGVNGKRSMVLDLSTTNPEGWEKDTNPFKGNGINDAIIYEAHIRDITVGEDNGILNQGKFLGMAEENTQTSKGIKTGLSHIKELGITHLHILPMYDFGSVDEKGTGYNWGYDPVNYNIPEGSYSTDAEHGEVRVKEMKTMIKGLHDNGISVVMDVVYNHVYNAENFCFNQLVPGYFSRINENGSYSNGSGCGNDTATERSMVRKYIVDSVNYWADEYHIDGFRFDLVGLMDVELMNEIVESVHEKHPNVIFYGEGWSMTTAVTKEEVLLATQSNSELVPGFAFFNDTIRDGIKGSVFNEEPGFVSGASGYEPKIRRSFFGADTWCKSPTQTINYASCHDNNTLYDRLRLSLKDTPDEEIVKMNNLAASIYMLSQGTPFVSAGEEMLRTKTKEDGSFDSNSYASGDDVNKIDWNSLSEEKYSEVFEYYKGLIKFRKAHPALRLTDASMVESHIKDTTGAVSHLVSFEISGEGIEGETAEAMIVVFNAGDTFREVMLPSGNWNVYINDKTAGTVALEACNERTVVMAHSALVLIKEDASKVGKETEISEIYSDSENAKESKNNPRLMYLSVGLGALLVFGILFLVIKKKRK